GGGGGGASGQRTFSPSRGVCDRVVSLLAVAAAAAFGAGDFLGGLASRRTGVLVTTAAAQAAGFSLMLPVLLLLVATPDRASLMWGGVGGLAACVLLLGFFR